MALVVNLCANNSPDFTGDAHTSGQLVGNSVCMCGKTNYLTAVVNACT